MWGSIGTLCRATFATGSPALSTGKHLGLLFLVSLLGPHEKGRTFYSLVLGDRSLGPSSFPKGIICAAIIIHNLPQFCTPPGHEICCPGYELQGLE